MWKCVLLGFLLLIGCGTAQAFEGRRVFMPPNDLARYDSVQRPNITEDEFNKVLDVIEEVYKPIFAKFGATFNLERDWADSTVNAYADQNGKIWTVHMYGGMARRSEMNIAGFGLVACHEIGHHLGGFPTYSDSPWASNEGNSDYFANHVCAPKVLGYLPVPAVTGVGKDKCDSAWSDQTQRELCYRGVDGGLSLGALLAALGGSKKPTYETPDQSQVSKTSDAHPAAQCRTDTYLAGSICTKPFDDAYIPRDEFAFCDTRPRCWFKPSGGTEPNPTPTPNPGGGADMETEAGLNEVRMSLRLPTLAHDDRIVCATSAHASDLTASTRCSHTGSDGSQPYMRLRKCNYRSSAMEMVTCNTQTSDKAINNWMRSQSNYQVIRNRSWKRIGCSTQGNNYVCILGY